MYTHSLIRGGLVVAAMNWAKYNLSKEEYDRISNSRKRVQRGIVLICISYIFMLIPVLIYLCSYGSNMVITRYNEFEELSETPLIISTCAIVVIMVLMILHLVTYSVRARKGVGSDWYGYFDWWFRMYNYKSGN